MTGEKHDLMRHITRTRKFTRNRNRIPVKVRNKLTKTYVVPKYWAKGIETRNNR